MSFYAQAADRIVGFTPEEDLILTCALSYGSVAVVSLSPSLKYSDFNAMVAGLDLIADDTFILFLEVATTQMFSPIYNFLILKDQPIFYSPNGGPSFGQMFFQPSAEASQLL